MTVRSNLAYTTMKILIITYVFVEIFVFGKDNYLYLEKIFGISSLNHTDMCQVMLGTWKRRHFFWETWEVWSNEQIGGY